MKRLIAVLIFIPLLFSCSPSKTEYNESGLVSGTASAAGGVDSPYTPKTVYTLNADEDDFLDQSFQLPFYADKTTEQLQQYFEKSSMAHLGPGSIISAVLPETVVFLSGQFAYDKKTGRISRTCKDPQCRHSKLFGEIYDECKFITGVWLIYGGRVYCNIIDLGQNELVTKVFTTDFSFADPHYADLPKGTVMQGYTEDGRMILRKEQFVMYIDENGVQRKKQGNFEILLYDEKDKKTTVVFAPEEVFFTYPYDNDIFCLLYPKSNAYVFTDNCTNKIPLGNIVQFVAFFDKKAFFIDKDTRRLMQFDMKTHEISDVDEKRSFITDVRNLNDTGKGLCFTYECDIADLRPERLSADHIAEIQDFAEKNNISKVYVVFRCDYECNTIEPIYFSANRIDELGVDGEVIYMIKTHNTNVRQFTAYDMSSGVELQIRLPRSEEHYPGEYGYDENWRRGVN